MTTQQIEAGKVQVGMKLMDDVRNRLDPRFGTKVARTITQVEQNPYESEGFVLLYGVLDNELSESNDPSFGGPVVKADHLVTVEID